MTQMPGEPERVHLYKVDRLDKAAVERALEDIGLARGYTRVLVKPNFCFAEPIPGATTDPDFLKAVLEVLVSRSKEVIVVESDFRLSSADATFDQLGIRAVVEGTGARLVNLSRHLPAAYQRYLFPHDVLVNLCIMKTHEFTRMSGAVKNLFGLIPDRRRFRYHPMIARVLAQLHTVFRKQLILMDGVHAMEGYGPTKGHLVNTGTLLAGTCAPAVDTVACRIMGLDAATVEHLAVTGAELAMGPVEAVPHGITLEEAIRPFQPPQLDPISAAKIWTWKYPALNALFFDSPLYVLIKVIGKSARRVLRLFLRYDRID